jgi:phosphate transport system substrate-binding protein
MDTMQREFIRMVVSKDGQEVVVRDGYVPLPKAVTDQVLKDIGVK